VAARNSLAKDAPSEPPRLPLTTDERARFKQFERENVELRRANEILRLASAYFAKAELDRRAK
jgi:transposase